MLPLFQQYPLLARRLPYVSLGEFPTPVQPLTTFGEAIGAPHLFVKRDDLSGRLYGGNKVRKLEFLLARAKLGGAHEVITFGGAGSNHALATAIYAREMGLGSISMVVPQPNAHAVRRNLLMSHAVGAQLHQQNNEARLVADMLRQMVARKLARGRFPHIVPLGGTSPYGTIGFVNAAFELKQQIKDGLMPEPDFIYCALGTCGTAVGLALGLRAARLKTKVVAVRVVDKKRANRMLVQHAYRAANALLHRHDPLFPLVPWESDRLRLRDDFFGGEYGLYTPAGREAIDALYEAESLKLECTYTGKALAALVDDTGRGRLRDKVVLFWNTYNSRDLTADIAGVDYRDLPPAFHRYFEQDVQPLDR